MSKLTFAFSNSSDDWMFAMSAPALKRSLVDIALEQIRQRIDNGT